MKTQHIPNLFSARRVSVLLGMPLLLPMVAASAPPHAQGDYAVPPDPGDIEMQMAPDVAPVVAVEVPVEDGPVALPSAAEPSLPAGELGGGWLEPAAQTKSWTPSGPWEARYETPLPVGNGEVSRFRHTASD